MSSVGITAIDDLTTILGGWTSANTDTRTPTITDNLTTPWEDLEFKTTDIVYVKYDIELVNTGLYALSFLHTVSCSIEIICPKINPVYGGKAHFKKVVEEAARLIKANPRYTGYAEVVLKGTRMRYNKDKAVFLCTMDIELLKVKTS